MKDFDEFRVAIIIPTFNEARYIEAVLETLVTQCPDRVEEILIADGRSEDDTRAVIEKVRLRHPKIRLIDNPARLQAPGVNLAVRSASPKANVLIRIDAHAGYPQDFVENLLAALKDTGAQSVVVRLRSIGQGCFQKAVGAISNTVLGTGGAVHRMGVQSRFVDHGHHAAFLRHAYEAVGGYDENFAAAEDAELDHRLTARGGKIWFAGDIVVDYFPRDTPSRLAKQYYRNGVGRAQTVLRHGKIRLRQTLPPVFLIAMAMCLLLSWAWPAFMIGPLVYLLICLGAGAVLAVKEKSLCMLASVIIAPIIHLSWAAGFLRYLLFGAPYKKKTSLPVGATAP